MSKIAAQNAHNTFIFVCQVHFAGPGIKLFKDPLPGNGSGHSKANHTEAGALPVRCETAQTPGLLPVTCSLSPSLFLKEGGRGKFKSLKYLHNNAHQHNRTQIHVCECADSRRRQTGRTDRHKTDRLSSDGMLLVVIRKIGGSGLWRRREGGGFRLARAPWKF